MESEGSQPCSQELPFDHVPSQLNIIPNHTADLFTIIFNTIND
jgi:hypothetical protein